MAQASRRRTKATVLASHILVQTFRDSSYLILLGIAIYTIIALASYSPDDVGWSYTGGAGDIRNSGGIWGAWLADVLYHFLGHSAYLLPLGLLLCIWVSLRAPMQVLNHLLQWTGLALVISGHSLLVSLYPIYPQYADILPAGGILGGLLNQYLVMQAGYSGALIYSVTSILVGLGWLLHISWVRITVCIIMPIFHRFVALSLALRNALTPALPASQTKTITLSLANPLTWVLWLLDVVGGVIWNFGVVLNVLVMPRKQTGSELLSMPPNSTHDALPEDAWCFVQEEAISVPPLQLSIPAPLPEAERLVVQPQPESLPRLLPIPTQELPEQVMASARQEPSLGLDNWRWEEELIMPHDAPLTTQDDETSETEDETASAMQAIRLPDADMEIPNIATLPPLTIERAYQAPTPTSVQPYVKPLECSVSNGGTDTAHLPTLDLLDLALESPIGSAYSVEYLEKLARQVEARLADFGVDVQVVGTHPGPVITRLELVLAPGTKASKITGLARDLARSLSMHSIRVVEVIPGKPFVGLELPNKSREIVRLSEVLKANEYQVSPVTTLLMLGKDVSGKPSMIDIAKMPHLLVAGTTGSGKSVALNTMIISLLYKATATELRMIMIDPKMLELSVYDGIPHLLTPVVTDMREAANALRWCVGEMERRYNLMATQKVRDIVGYNTKVNEAIQRGQPIPDPTIAKESLAFFQEQPTLQPLPYIVVVIDELADMMMMVGKKVEELIARLAQKARACGIHLILATQRPSVDVLTGLIKANIPARIAFQVSSKIDSRTILDQMGAESLLGHGDMLYLGPGSRGVPTRYHGAFVADHEVNRVVEFLKQHGGTPDYIDAILEDEEDPEDKSRGGDDADSGGEQDPLYDQAAQMVLETRKVSISWVQRRLRIGYNRAARLVEAMEDAGLVGKPQSGGVREVLVAKDEA